MPERFHFLALDAAAQPESFAADVRAGLTAVPRSLPCRYFYDEEGSLLFEEICRLEEYYPTRTERALLERHADEVAALFPEPVSLVELGSGSAAKTRLLIEAFLHRHGQLRYVPIDIAAAMLEESSRALLRDYPALEIAAVAAEYEAGLERLRAENRRPKLVAWLGSNVGNLHRHEAATFLRRIRAAMGERDRFLMGVDMRKAVRTLERAYDDARGVTARFNLNLLARINRELGADFELAAFRHRATWNEAAGRMEIYLDSLRDQRVHIRALDLELFFAAGEAIHTENSYKYSPAELEALAGGAGLRIERQWFDPDRLFSDNLLSPL